MQPVDPAVAREDCRSSANLFRSTRTERESRSVMTFVGLPGAMAASDLNPAPNRGLVGIFKIGGRGVEVWTCNLRWSTKKGRQPIFPCVGMLSGGGEVPLQELDIAAT